MFLLLYLFIFYSKIAPDNILRVINNDFFDGDWKGTEARLQKNVHVYLT